MEKTNNPFSLDVICLFPLSDFLNIFPFCLRRNCQIFVSPATAEDGQSVKDKQYEGDGPVDDLQSPPSSQTPSIVPAKTPMQEQ
jgi:hypothetical protein